uniref:Uncharacterized protein n=1 Tax=Mola mola TaxID=94237 RepID=A0A3Q3VRH8_MOLML
MSNHCRLKTRHWESIGTFSVFSPAADYLTAHFGCSLFHFSLEYCNIFKVIEYLKNTLKYYL